MRATLLLLCAAIAAPAAAAPSDLLSSKHNLSISGPGPIKSPTENEVCIFCHVGHRGAELGHNRPYSVATYAPYSSSTLGSPTPGAPSGATRLCLSCHDGTIAVGQTLSSGNPLPVLGTAPDGTLPAGKTNLGTDLRRTHPVSFKPAATPRLLQPPAGDPVRLDHGGQLQCTSCHDAHKQDADPVLKKFLAKPNSGSALCTTCHSVPGWTTSPSAHQASQALVANLTARPLPYPTVAENGCGSCHAPHNATSAGRLVARADADREDQVCLDCHDGRVARLDLTADYAKAYNHAAGQASPGVHDASESPSSATFRLPELSSSAPRHAACVDCHDPHSARQQPAVAPSASGLLAGVWGIDRFGNKVSPALNQYEVCFKCHGDSANQPAARGPVPPDTLTRRINDVNLRHQLDLGAPSFHPVEGPGKSSDVPSLLPPWSTSSVVLCTDCHASDSGPGAGGAGPAGPHGSSYRHLLERNYTTTDLTPESPSAYALCYKCHDRSVLLSSASGFPLHSKHVVEAQTPCSACHASHGVSALAGSETNHAHLIDFDTSIVQPDATGRLQYDSAGSRHGSCALTCHGRAHPASSY